jgi:Rieske Fe-S protein
MSELKAPTDGDSISGGGRRTFLGVILGTGFFGLIASVVYPAWKFVFPPRSVRVAEEAVLAGTEDEFPPNSGKLVMFEGEAALVLRTPEGEFRAFLGTCSHLACNVEYRPDLTQIYCACHDGRFDLTGKNVQGPPPRPLTALEVQLRGGEVLVSRGT